MSVYFDRVNFVHEVNAYVNSRHAQLANSHFAEDIPLNFRKRHNLVINPEWKAALDAYHDELDRLREDWALDVCGRRIHELVYFANRRLDPQGRKKGLQKLPCYWEFRVKEPLYPSSWKSLRQVYVHRLNDINNKYYNRIGTSAYCIAYIKKRRAQYGFGDLIPERPLKAGERSSSRKEANVDVCIVVDGGDDDVRCEANSLKKTRTKDAITQAGDENTAELP